jgi:Protein of unknown function (DUF2865)
LGPKHLLLLLLWVLAVAAPGGAAMADVCRSIQAELAAIGRGPSAGQRQSAARHAAEAQRVHAHMRSIGCDRSGIFAFGAPPPPECPALRGRYHHHAQAAAAGAGGEDRRRQLMSMLVSHDCRSSPRSTPRSEPLVAGLFDDRRRRSPIEVRPEEDDEGLTIEGRIRTVQGPAICVRTCDGYFFPVQLRPGSSSIEGEEACQALCPASETRLYTMRSREIGEAVSTAGELYEDLPNAFLHRKRFDPACSCRRGPQQGGAEVLNPGGSGGTPFSTLNPDVEPAEEPPLRGFEGGPKPRDTGAFGKRPPPAPPAPPHPPNEAPADRTVTADQGEVTEFRARDGTRRTVRIIAPELSRGPTTARDPSAPARAPAP